MQSRFILSLLLLFVGVGTAQADPDARFQTGDQIVTDTQTGLVWQKTDSHHDLKHGMTWYQALEYVEKKNLELFGGHSDWRLPTLQELQGLWDSARPLKSKDGEPIGLPEGFQDGGSYYLWTANERNLNHAWYFGLGQKEDYFNLKELGDLDQGVKMVRDAKK